MNTTNPEREVDLLDQDPETFIIHINEKLFSAGAGNAELAFGLGCVIGIIPLGILVLLLFILGMRGWAAFGIVLLIGVLLITAVSTYLASRARTGAIRGAFDREVEPAILDYLGMHEIKRHEFQQIMDRILPQDAPLRRYVLAGESSAIPLEE